MRTSMLFLLPCLAAAVSPLTTLRGGGAEMVAAKSLATVTVINGAYMALAPEQAGTKLYQLSNEDITPTVKRLIKNNGMSALSLATTSSLLAYSTDTKPSMAIVAGLIPRLAVLLYSAVGEPNRMNLNGLVPAYALQIACAASLIKNKWIDATVAMKIMSFIYISAGVGLSLAPQTLSKQLLKLDEATEQEQRCLRAQAKTDLINGVLCWALAVGEAFPRAMGLSCVAWIAAAIWMDFIVPGTYTDPAAIVQLLIPIVAAWILL